MTATPMPGQPGPRLQSPTARLPNWYVDPLDSELLRYHDGVRWTFWTASIGPRYETPQAVLPEAEPELRRDIAAAVSQARNLLGAMKEIRRLESQLWDGEDVVALTAARGFAGTGVLACTTQRVIFTFDGLLSKEFQVASLPQIHVVELLRADRTFRVFTSRRTKRARPAFEVKVQSFKEGERVALAINEHANAPRLDTLA